MFHSEERQRLVDALQALDHVASPDQFKACLDFELQHIFPHGMLVCGIGRALPSGGVETESTLLHRFPREYLESLRQADGSVRSALIDRWLATRRPVLVDLEHDVSGWPGDWLQGLRPYDFRNFASHAMFDVGGQFVTSFCFARIPGRLGPRHDQLLRLLVPHMHLALVRALRPLPAAAQAGEPLLNTRQEEILRWVQIGKTNVEIAMILGMSESNVKYHLRQIFNRLSVSNRAHAVARAFAMKLAVPA